MPDPIDLARFPLHLGLGATAVVQPEHTGGLEWYAGYGARHASDGAEGRLVAVHTFDEPWGMWEMHPVGAEVVICLTGRITLIQEVDGVEVRTELEPQQAAINPAGVWHTADADSEVTVLFITAGLGTEHRPR